MSDPHFQVVLDQFRRALEDCRQLYLRGGRECLQQHPGLVTEEPGEFLQRMDDLHKGLLVKLYVTVAEADRQWSSGEQRLAQVLFEHLWQQQFSGERLREAARHIFQQAAELKWYSLVRPFDQIASLRNHVGELETVVLRVANLVAKADGQPSGTVLATLRSIQQELDQHLRPIPLDEPGQHDEADRLGSQAVQQIRQETDTVRKQCQLEGTQRPAEPERSPQQKLDEALAELDQLIGLDNVKHEIRTLTNFLKVQKQREQMGLPPTPLSLHMVFGGNPGTGKTTVARILGRIFGAMGILDKGHLVETDRSGLVAEYSGQTGPKTNKKVDEALDGVLFVDEAYSLVAQTGDDPYGREALQTLLKRLEDQRHRLVVILAGYPTPIQELLASNPGLSSRFNTQLTFDDYRASELGQIFQRMCATNHYDPATRTQVKLLLGFQWLYEQRDEHFGNGRLVRNTFENAIRRLANRIAGVTPLTEELLTVLQPEDIHLPGVPEQTWQNLDDPQRRFAFRCPGCENESTVPTNYLGRRVRCNKCSHRFVAAWGEPC